MKKGLLTLSILLFLASGVAFAYAFDRFHSASESFQRAETSLKKMQDAKDMKAAEGEADWVKMDSEMGGNARQAGMMGAGGGAILLIASVLLFLKSRPAKAPA